MGVSDLRRVLGWLWPFHPRPRVVARFNTVDLGADLESVELLMGIEAKFAIKFTDAEAEATLTVGDLCDLVVAKTGLSFDQAWPEVVRITRENSGCDAPIDQRTAFFAIHAEPRNPAAERD